MPGINVLPAPSITVAPEADDTGNERTLLDVPFPEGVAEGTASVARVFSGALSDRWGRKWLIAAAIKDAHIGE